MLCGKDTVMDLAVDGVPIKVFWRNCDTGNRPRCNIHYFLSEQGLADGHGQVVW
mgnify:CR=1 FL=1